MRRYEDEEGLARTRRHEFEIGKVLGKRHDGPPILRLSIPHVNKIDDVIVRTVTCGDVMKVAAKRNEQQQHCTASRELKTAPPFSSLSRDRSLPFSTLQEI